MTAAIAQAASEQRGCGGAGHGGQVRTIIPAPRPAVAQGPRVRASGRASATAASARSRQQRRGAPAARASEPATSNGSRAPATPPAERRRAAGERQRDVPDPRGERGGEHAEPPRVRAAAPRAYGAGERGEAERGRRARAAGRARRGGWPRGSRHVRQPAGGERGVEKREPERDVAERQHRHGEGQRDARRERAGGPPRRRERRARTASRAGRTAARPRSSRRGARRGPAVRADPPSMREGSLRSRDAARTSPTPRRAARRRASARRRPPGRVGDDALSTQPQQPLRQVGAELPSGRAPSSIACAVRASTRQNGCPPASASHSITPTAQTSAAGVASPPASRSGEMYASVPGTSPASVSLVGVSHLREAEVQHPAGDALASARITFDGLTSRCRTPPRGRARGLRGPARRPRPRRRRQLAGAHRLAVRPAGDVLVGDVDVTRVAAEAVRAQAGGVA